MAMLSGWNKFDVPNLGANALDGFGKMISALDSLQTSTNQSFQDLKTENTNEANKAFLQYLADNPSTSFGDALNNVNNSQNVSTDALLKGQALLDSRQLFNQRQYEFNSKKAVSDFNYALNAAAASGDLKKAKELLSNPPIPGVLSSDYSIPDLNNIMFRNKELALSAESNAIRWQDLKNSRDLGLRRLALQEEELRRKVDPRIATYVSNGLMAMDADHIRLSTDLNLQRKLARIFGVSDLDFAVGLSQYLKGRSANNSLESTIHNNLLSRGDEFTAAVSEANENKLKNSDKQNILSTPSTLEMIQNFGKNPSLENYQILEKQLREDVNRINLLNNGI